MGGCWIRILVLYLSWPTIAPCAHLSSLILMLPNKISVQKNNERGLS